MHILNDLTAQGWDPHLGLCYVIVCYAVLFSVDSEAYMKIDLNLKSYSMKSR